MYMADAAQAETSDWWCTEAANIMGGHCGLALFASVCSARLGLYALGGDGARTAFIWAYMHQHLIQDWEPLCALPRASTGQVSAIAKL